MYGYMDRSAIWALFKRGMSKAEIARKMGCTRKTVRRLLKEEMDKKFESPERSSSVDRYRNDIYKWLSQGISVIRMYEMAQEDPDFPYVGSKNAFYDRVRKFRKEWKKNDQEVWLRFEGLPGEYVQIDWGEIRNFPFLIQEKTTRYFLCARLKYSRFGYVEFTDNMKQETLIRCMLRAFEYFGGVSWVSIFDNMKTVTIGRDEKGKPIWNDTFQKFAVELEFHPQACHPNSGNQKGTVENLVKFVKSNFIAGREFLDDDDLNTQCTKWQNSKNNSISQAHGKVPAELLNLEKEKFTKLRETAESYGIYKDVVVGPESLVNVDGNRYSVPVGYVGQALSARIRQNKIDFYRNDILVSSHKRVNKQKIPVIIPEHFEDILETKPQGRVMLYRGYLMSVDSSVKTYIAELCRRFKGSYGPHILKMYELLKKYGDDELGCACALASEHGAYGADYLVALLRKPVKTPVISAVEVDGVPDQNEVDRTLSFYENFVKGGC